MEVAGDTFPPPEGWCAERCGRVGLGEGAAAAKPPEGHPQPGCGGGDRGPRGEGSGREAPATLRAQTAGITSSTLIRSSEKMSMTTVTTPSRLAGLLPAGTPLKKRLTVEPGTKRLHDWATTAPGGRVPASTVIWH